VSISPYDLFRHVPSQESISAGSGIGFLTIDFRNCGSLSKNHSKARVKHFWIIFILHIACARPEGTLAIRRPAFKIRDQYFQGQAEISSTSKGFRIALQNDKGEQLDRAIFNYHPYQLDTADINHDGRTEILIGVIKSTEFDDNHAKRLFILRIDDGQLRPLWLGSKVCQELVDFKTLPNGKVRTLEKTKSDQYVIGVYEWQGFGLALIKYISNEKSYDEAFSIFNS
jgi:hypothetical protein